MMTRRHFAWLIPCLMFLHSCGDGGGGAGVGGLLGAVGGGGSGGGGGEQLAGASVYVTNSGSDSVSGFTVNASSGRLTLMAGAPFQTIPTPSAIAASANGLFIYIANSDRNTVTTFRVGTNGTLVLGDSTSGNPNPVSVGTTPRALAISKDSQFLYVANSKSDDVTVFKIGTAGVLTLVPQAEGRSTKPVGAGVSSPIALAIAPNGRFLYVGTSTSSMITTFQVDSSGVLTLVPAAGSGTNPIASSGTGLTAIALSPNGQFLYVTNETSNNVTVFRVESSGLLTLVPPTSSNPISTGGTTPNALAVASDEAHLYIANGGGTVSTFAIGSNGLLTLVPSSGASQNPVPVLPAGSTPVALVISPDGQYLYVANRTASGSGGTVSAYTIVPEAGTLVPVTQLLGNPFPVQNNPFAIATLAPAP
ncbi:MAG: beta-propeller fold lactonase family protein [Nitrospira sp.]